MIKSKTDLEHINIYLVLGAFFVCYGIFSLNGYGNDDDIYGMLNSWRILVTEHHYVPSRFQGCLIPEMVVGLSSQIGGFYLSNFISATLSLATLFIFYLLLLPITTPLMSVLAVVAIGSNPFWIIASSISMDYIYAAFFFMFGIFLLLNRRSRLAGLFFALAVSSRITYAPMVIISFLFYVLYVKNKPEFRKSWGVQGIIVFLLATSLLYLPVFIVSGMNFSFLAMGADAPGGFLGIVVRFIYKNIYVWGLPTFIVLLIFFLQERAYYFQKIWKNPFHSPPIKTILVQAVFLFFVYNEIMFFRLPHEYFYLLPIFFCVAYFILSLPNKFNKKVTYLILIFTLNILYSIVFNFDVIDTYQTQGVGTTVHSDGAKVNFSIKEGVLVREFKWRSIYQKYQVNKFNQKWRSSGFQLDEPR